MAILCFGGSFNPIHHGHLICARAAAEVKEFERIMLIPSAQPPHKPAAADLADPKQRLEMCRLATKDSSLFAVDDIELNRAGPSYTIETTKELRRGGFDSIHWLIGADMLYDLPKWHQPQALLYEVNFIIMARPGWVFDWPALPPEFRHLEDHVIETPLIDISATDIRRRVSQGKPIDYLTPPSVCEYIHRNKLYVALPM